MTTGTDTGAVVMDTGEVTEPDVDQDDVPGEMPDTGGAMGLNPLAIGGAFWLLLAALAAITRR